ncbi:M20/M25/M40 family metallo-hydrolase [Aggregicoccus sp. 17bor-14]|uniref:M28 family peptidase n=1 Tax=Myxococcaceae TaxID=31 RepID=UPI00129C7D76|nr:MULTISPECIES: M28 family peptidase [Myxococcaceae]MBF5045154.1 M20/M25/M40 family metallo-hydrolase [Simulacricoccus sp. 17bor-14]MRI90896.1 M20/M25/M40 family metallo-hydrolase [Aggregicoccus sp. 17bor-14]
MPLSPLALPTAALALLSAAPAKAPAATPAAQELDPRVASRLMGPALTEGHAWALLTELTDTIGPRLSGSAGAEAAVQWARARLEADGVKVRLEPVQAPHWVRGVETGEVLAATGRRAQTLHLTALGGSVPTEKEGLTAEVVEVHSFEELTALGQGARGKIVLFNHDMSTAEGYGRASALRTRGASEAAKLGAVGMLVRSLATASLRTPHTGAMRYEEGVAKVPAAAVTTEDAALLHRLLAANPKEPVRVKMVLGCQTLPDVPSSNVVAEIRGRERPDEVVVLGAHLDSWDLGTGAHDDGAGVVMAMDTARLLAHLERPPRRTVRIVLFMNEENGLAGGRAYAAAHAGELAKHVAGLESDAGGGRPLGVTVKAGPGADALMRRLLPPLQAVGAAQLLEGEAGGADLSPMASAQVPFAGVRVDTSHYFDVHHTAADTLDKVDPQALAQSTAAFAWVTYALAEMRDVLPRPEATERTAGAPAPTAPASKPAAH